MKLNINDEKIVNVEELINLNLATKPRDEDFIITADTILNIQNLLNDYFDICEKVKSVVEVLNETEALRFAARRHEQNLFEKVDKILEPKNVDINKFWKMVFNEGLESCGIKRLTEVDESGNVTWPKFKQLEEDLKKSPKLNVNKYYLCKLKTGEKIICEYVKNEAFEDFDLYDKNQNIHYKMEAFDEIIEVDCLPEDLKNVYKEYIQTDKTSIRE